MDAEEKLTALKKAYADIILGISKEAAARVIASERKSLRYQHELKVAKEEGVRMLLRLKQMMDSQNGEAEAVSLNQQKKIEELEAQLQEAEDIVKDLREELGEAQAELERVKNETLHHGNEPENALLREIPEENQSSKYLIPPNEAPIASDVRVSYMSHRNECRKCYNRIVCTCGVYIRNRDLPSIILRGKELGLYRNGCTQRIRACERDLLDGDLCLSGETDKVKNGNKCNEGKDISRAPPAGAQTLSELEKKLSASSKIGSVHSFLRKRKRGVRRRKTVIPLGRKQSSLSLKHDQRERPVISGPRPERDGARFDENTSKIGPRLSDDKAEPETQLGCEDDIQKERNVETTKMHEDEGVNIKLDVEKVDDGLESNLSNATKDLSSQTLKGRVIKYTFQRKRKRQTESNGFLGMEKQTGDRQNGNHKVKRSKSSLSMESSRDSRRLAQVARQLISLSEKKWWH
ncbi:hypothetical protein CDL12_04632 [Handroanthus impetiginosus]|uniref:Uncharacterized protein n=1 Tax=Handroanthus impetiginosus TaxID=429701 RepID=A0A2G9HYS1_9LAMI|nr:hypothetical protein CDL12_04632 [Handroanthus impetiginosus]